MTHAIRSLLNYWPRLKTALAKKHSPGDVCLTTGLTLLLLNEQDDASTVREAGASPVCPFLVLGALINEIIEVRFPLLLQRVVARGK